MSMLELKQEVYDSWVKLVGYYNHALVEPEKFKPEIRKYGDLRCKSTWRKAFAAFEAQAHWYSGITEHTAVVYVFGDAESVWDIELRRMMLEYFLTIPGAREFIVRGLEQVFQSSDHSDKECANEVLAMVGGESRGAKEGPNGSVRRLPDISAS